MDPSRILKTPAHLIIFSILFNDGQGIAWPRIGSSIQTLWALSYSG